MLSLSFEINTALLVLMCLGLFIALFFNLLSVFTILRNKRFCTVTNFYQVSNCLLISAIICISGWMFPLYVISSNHVTYSMRLFMNKVIISTNASVTGHDVMNAIDRYNALSRPLKMRAIAGKKRCIVVIGLIWIFSSALCVPNAMRLFGEIKNNNSTRLYYGESNLSTIPFESITTSTMNDSMMKTNLITQRLVSEPFEWWPIIIFVTLFLTPFTINLTLFILTVKRLRHSVKDIYKLPDGNGIHCKEITSKITRQTNKLRRYSQRAPLNRQRTLRFSAPPNCVKSPADDQTIPTKKSTYRERALSEPNGRATLQHRLYSMVFPSISFVAAVPLNQGERRSSAPGIISMRVTQDRVKPVVESKLSVDSGVSTISGTATTASDDESQQIQAAKHPRNRNGVVPTWLWRNRIKAVQNLAFALAMFCVEWLPYHILLLLQGCCEDENKSFRTENDWISLSQYINGFFLALVAFTNPVLHCVCSASFRESFMANMRRLLSCGLLKYPEDLQNSRRRRNSTLPYSTSRFTSMHSQTFTTKNIIYDLSKTAR
uniref:uncharacterized protein LOC120331023 isoform X1 n=1 Tax=Styela clava TaxID=7725 RepID=UPI00193A4D05|nr:uncharacterized protein LOC120331023 isoform X1 [Styela clava]